MHDQAYGTNLGYFYCNELYRDYFIMILGKTTPYTH